MTTRASVASLRAMRSENYARRNIRVAILTDDRVLSRTIGTLVASMGWDAEVIQPVDLADATSPAWDLIVVATNGETIPIATTCAQASRDARQPVLVVSYNQDPQVIADALNSGADDYVIAPFDASECQARMRVLVKRSETPSRLHTRMVWIEPLLRTIGIGSRYATLSSREWTLLELLIEAKEAPVSAATIEERLWGSAGRQSTLASVVSRLRDRLQSHRLDGIEIVTVRNVGYAVRFDDLDTSHLFGSPQAD
jgi:DNA-binding response OmpR family regulator